MSRYFHIRTNQFPVLDGEEEELTNPGTYGKAFAEYLQSRLHESGYSVPFVCCEDWGWWVEIKLPQCSLGLCCYRQHDENEMCEFACSTSPESNRVWSWKKFRRINMEPELNKLTGDLVRIFETDQEIEFLGCTEEYPL